MTPLWSNLRKYWYKTKELIWMALASWCKAIHQCCISFFCTISINNSLTVDSSPDYLQSTQFQQCNWDTSICLSHKRGHIHVAAKNCGELDMIAETGVITAPKEGYWLYLGNKNWRRGFYNQVELSPTYQLYKSATAWLRDDIIKF